MLYLYISNFKVINAAIFNHACQNSYEAFGAVASTNELWIYHPYPLQMKKIEMERHSTKHVLDVCRSHGQLVMGTNRSVRFPSKKLQKAF